MHSFNVCYMNNYTPLYIIYIHIYLLINTYIFIHIFLHIVSRKTVLGKQPISLGENKYIHASRGSALFLIMRSYNSIKKDSS